jgi:hypothetical protein
LGDRWEVQDVVLTISLCLCLTRNEPIPVLWRGAEKLKIWEEFGWNGRETVSRAAKVLKGTASTWFENWEPEQRDWESFKSDLIDLFPPKRNLAEKLKRPVLLTSEEFQTYCEYAREKLLLLNRTRIKFIEAELVELIIADLLGISVRMGAINNGAQTTSDLLILLSSYVKKYHEKKNRNARGNSWLRQWLSKCKTGPRNKPDGNYSRLQFKLCFACGDYGHIQSTCTKRTSAESPKRLRVSNDGPSSSKTCEFCKKVGHNVSSCFAKERSERVNNNRCVNLCVGDACANDLTLIVIRGKPVFH